MMKQARVIPVQGRITVSLPPGRISDLKARVARGEAPSVSAYIEQVLSAADDRSSLREVLDEMDREYGSPSEEDRRWAREVLGI
jgi:hypothetical protein